MLLIARGSRGFTDFVGVDDDMVWCTRCWVGFDISSSTSSFSSLGGLWWREGNVGIDKKEVYLRC